MKPSEFPTLDGFDPFAPEFLRNPAPMIKRAQAKQPVFYYPPLKLWVITRYDDICRAARDWQTFSSKALGVVPPPEHLKGRIPENFADEHFIAIDPPEHTLDRGAVATNFLPKELQRQEPNIRRIANELIDTFLERGSCDLMREFAYPLSLRVIIGLLGVPPERAADYRQWTEDMFAVFTPKSGVSKPMPEAERNERWSRLADAQDFYRGLVEERTRCPADDLVTRMLAAKDGAGNPAVPESRVIRHITEFVAAGNDTTANLIGQMMLFCDRHPDQFAEVKRNHDLLANVVEETLRMHGTSPGLFRTTTKNVEIGGAVIPANAQVWLLFFAGGLDETKFPHSETFDIRRANANRHLAFGHGRHSCLGNILARLEAKVGFEILLERIPDIRVAPGQVLEYQPTMTVLTLNHLQTEWKGAGAAGPSTIRQGI
jgi:cytochrome P450